ncbi:unnamed protein product [Adineta steineri]|uniref:YihY/virulence factor BrkB family protein n=1 Tax=Adineta steineri TaxID=433720 RepID=A0A819WP66_9BILA|nr:unnamed protein product [Adineta steineri]
MMNSVWRPIQRGLGFGQPTPPTRSAWGFIKKILNDRSLGFGSLLAYTFIIALLPLATAAFGIFGLVLSEDSSAKQSIIDSIMNSLPDNTTKAAVGQVTQLAANNLSSDAGGILAIGIILSIWGGSRLFVALDEVITIFYRTPDRPFVKKNLIAIGMLILFIILILLIIVASGAPSFLINALPNQNGAQFGIFVAGIVLSIAMAFLLFLVIFLIVPNKKMKFKQAWLGALFAAILLDIFLILFPLYIRRFMGSFIGLIGFVVILLTFFYYFSIIVILGAQMNAYFLERIQPLPDGLGTFLSRAVGRMPRPGQASRMNYYPSARTGPRPRPSRYY